MGVLVVHSANLMNRTLTLRAGHPTFYNFLVVLSFKEVSLVTASVILARVQKDGWKSCVATMAELAASVLCNVIVSPLSNFCTGTVRAVADK
jgi:hypothetical protein